jgi:hypothetical protein
MAIEEPDERKIHVRICGGSAGKPVLLPGSGRAGSVFSFFPCPIAARR